MHQRPDSEQYCPKKMTRAVFVQNVKEQSIWLRRPNGSIYYQPPSIEARSRNITNVRSSEARGRAFFDPRPGCDGGLGVVVPAES